MELRFIQKWVSTSLIWFSLTRVFIEYCVYSRMHIEICSQYCNQELKIHYMLDVMVIKFCIARTRRFPLALKKHLERDLAKSLMIAVSQSSYVARISSDVSQICSSTVAQVNCIMYETNNLSCCISCWLNCSFNFNQCLEKKERKIEI